ncbi:MAG TPA: hypothetical protein VMH03_00055 [Terriglobales bacterium]|nr:hypothetical protein [Terriglobales bacterium]
MKTMELRPCNRRGTLAVAFTRTMFGIFFALVIALISVGAHAQSPQDLADPTPPPTPDATAEVAEPSVAAGPTVYVTDSAGRLATVTLGTYVVHIIGSEGVVLTDIGFNPKDGQLYGVSYTNFYRVNRTTGKATLIGSLGIRDATALVFDGQGVAFTAAGNSPELYTINLKTGHASPFASTTYFASAGDLTFYNGYLMESGYLLDTSDPYLVLLNPTTGKLELYAALNDPPIPNLLGLVCTGKDKLYGFAGTSVYQFLLTPTTGTPTTLTTVPLKSLAGKGLAQIWGAAYDGYFLY